MERADLIRLLGVSAVVAEARDVIVEEREPALFMKSFASGAAAGGQVFLADPSWGAGEREQFDALVKDQGDEQRSAPAFDLCPPPSAACPPSSVLRPPSSAAREGWLCIPTGGSSGNLKLARHDEETIAAAVRGFCDHFGVTRVNVVGLLPLYHVSGFMAWMRTLLTGGTYLAGHWKGVEAGNWPVLPAGEGAWFLSLVPTQLQRLLGNAKAEAWLRGFRAVFIGGGPAWPELIEAGARACLPLAFSYGMTETAAMVTALRPEEFLEGRRGSGSPLPHARVLTDNEGRIGVWTASLFRGYWPHLRTGDVWWTEDLGHFDAHGSLHVRGRRDALIITGGEKVDPSEVEAALRETGLFDDVVVLGVPDAEWGEIVVACYPAEAEVLLIGEQVINSHLFDHLAAYKRPKRYVAIPAGEWPRNEQGKVSRLRLRGRF